MKRTVLNIPDLNNFLKQVGLADKNHISFAKFVMESEVFCKNGQSSNVDENLMRYREI